MNGRLLLCCLAAACLCANAARADEAPLFATNTVMELTIPVDFANLCRPRESEDCEFTPTILDYGDESRSKRSIPIEIKIRGGWRSLTRNCSVPLLWVRFAEEDVPGTPFEGQTLLPLTTHCGKGLSLDAMLRNGQRSNYEQYLLREFLGHRIYSVLTEQSLRARLVRIGYPDPERRKRAALHYAFFTEHFDAMAARTGYQRPPRGQFDADRLDAQAAARLALFQYMIGNTDWSIVRERNTVLLQNGNRRLVPVPYDLDMSGLVAADYSGPAPGLPIDDVRDRYFLGFCQPGIDWDALFTDFMGKRDTILALRDRLPGLDRNSKRWVKHFLWGFFDDLGSQQQREEQIVRACQPWPPSADDHTTRLENGG
jgi:hypothetical protein